jgi:hypothetical protein
MMFVCELSTRFTSGSKLRSFQLFLDNDGSVSAMVFADESHQWPAQLESLGSSNQARLLYDPLDDGMEYIYLSWQDIDREVMERLIGQSFEDADYLPMPTFAGRARILPIVGEFPRSWGVMF